MEHTFFGKTSAKVRPPGSGEVVRILLGGTSPRFSQAKSGLISDYSHPANLIPPIFSYCLWASGTRFRRADKTRDLSFRAKCYLLSF